MSDIDAEIDLDEMERLFKLAVEKNRIASVGVVNEAEKLARSARDSSAGMPAIVRPPRPQQVPQPVRREGVTGKFAALRK